MMIRLPFCNALWATAILIGAGLLAGCGSLAPVTTPEASVLIPDTNFKLTTSAGVISNVQKVAAPSDAPTGYSYPAGFFKFTITGVTAGETVTVTIAAPSGTNPATYVRCAPSPGTCQIFPGATVTGNDVSFQLTDGGSGDDDGLVNSSIMDTGAVAVGIDTSATSYYMPFAASGGATGLFVVPSDQLSAAPEYVTGSAIGLSYAQVDQLLTNSSGQVYEQLPNTLVYATSGAAGGDHFFSLDLTSSSALTPTQVTNYTDTTAITCSGLFEDQTNPLDPTTAFFIFTTQGDGEACGSSTDLAYSFRVSDSATTAPIGLPISTISDLVTLFDPTSNTLTGLIGLITTGDSNGDLDFFTNVSFTKGTTLLTGVTKVGIVDAGESYVFMQVTTASKTSASKTSLYRFDSNGGQSADLYDFQNSGQTFAGAVRDPGQTYLYFGDNSTTDGTSATPFSDILLKVPLNGSSSAQTITTFTPKAGDASTTPSVIQLNDFAGSSLIFEVQPATPTAGNAAYIYSLPQTATAGTSPTSISSLPNGYYGYDVVANSQLFTNLQTFDASGNTSSLSAGVLLSDGSAVQTFSNSEFSGYQELRGGTLSAPTFTISNVMLLSGYTGTQSPGTTVNLGGATVIKVSTTNLAQTLITKQTAGQQTVSTYVLQDNEIPFLYAIGRPINATTTLLSNGSTFQSDAAALDLNQNVWEQITSTADVDEIPLIH